MSLETLSGMAERFLKPEFKDSKLGPVASDELFPEFEGPDIFLPVPTEISSVDPESRVVVYSDPRSAGADRFRLLQMRLKGLQASARRLKVLLITSPLPGDGKTTVSLNLATALAEKGKRPVLLLEADVYRPTLGKKLGLTAWPGLTECFAEGRDAMEAIRHIEPLGFYLLPAGQPITDANGLLHSEFMSQLITGLAATSFDWILLDAPPTTPVAEILALRGFSDATLLVARAEKTPREAIEESARSLGRDHVIGIVLNEVTGIDRVYSKYYNYSNYDAAAKPERAKGTYGLGLSTLVDRSQR